FVFAAEMAAGGFVGMKELEVAADDDAGAAEFAEDVGHHLVVAGELVVQPDVAQAEADLFEEAGDEFELDVDEGFAGYAAAKRGNAHDGIAVEDGNGDLGTEEFKFLLGLAIGAGLVAVAAEDAAQAGDLGADTGIQGEFKVFEQAGGEADGGRGAEAARILVG